MEERRECHTAFYIRIETDTEIKITWRPIPLFVPYVGLIFYLVFACLSNTTANIDNEFTFASLSGISLVFTIIYSIILLARTSRISREIKTATQEKTVEVSGRKRSLSHPMTITIKKDI